MNHCEKFQGISDAINSSPPCIVSRELNFHRVFCIAGGVGEARVGTSWRKIRAASEYPLENARFLFLTNAIKAARHLANFPSPRNPSQRHTRRRRLITSFLIRPTFPFLPFKMLPSVKLSLRQKFSSRARARRLFGIKTRFSSKSERGIIKSFGFVPFRLIL